MSFGEDFLDGFFDKGFNYFQNDKENDLSTKTFLFPKDMDKIEINPKYEEESFFIQKSKQKIISILLKKLKKNLKLKKKRIEEDNLDYPEK